MRVLFDNGVPRGVAAGLLEHDVAEARSLGWDTLRNGELLQAAEDASFDVFLTSDRNLRFQQNMSGRRLAIVVLSNSRWRLVRRAIGDIAAAIAASAPGDICEVEIPRE
jgi:hypothetical protein